LLAAGGDVADAAMRGDRAAIERLIRQRADVNLPQEDGATALHWAVYRGDPETTDLLIRQLMQERKIPVPPAGRTLNSICVVALCQGGAQ
jgi:ankyrin repeat protein